MADQKHKVVKFKGRHYTEVSMSKCREIALDLNAQGRNWHCHVLSPGCQLNPSKTKYAIIVENNSDNVIYYSVSKEFPELDKELVQLLHGEDILDADKAQTSKLNNELGSALILFVEKLDKQGVDWHHHMHFPSCVFNPFKGKWAITVEDGYGRVTDECYDNEPVDILRRLEVLYFRNLESEKTSAKKL